MASATGIPEQNPAVTENEPLLGRPGDATQKPDQALAFNLWNGTGILAQIGIWVLAGLVWVCALQREILSCVKLIEAVRSSGERSHFLQLSSGMPLLNRIFSWLTMAVITIRGRFLPDPSDPRRASHCKRKAKARRDLGTFCSQLDWCGFVDRRNSGHW